MSYSIILSNGKIIDKLIETKFKHQKEDQCRLRASRSCTDIFLGSDRTIHIIFVDLQKPINTHREYWNDSF